MEALAGVGGACSQRLHTGLIQSVQSILIVNTLSVAGAIMHHGKHLVLRDHTPKKNHGGINLQMVQNLFLNLIYAGVCPWRKEVIR